MDGQETSVDNSASASIAPVAPESIAPAAPSVDPATQPPQAQPGARDFNTLSAILDGADPSTLFGGQPTQPPAEATPPQQNQPQPQDTPAPILETEPLAIPDKFKNPDGTINSEALMRSYVGLEQVLGRQGSQLGQMSQLQNELNQYRALVTQARLQAQQQSAQNAQPAEPKPEPKFPWETEMTQEERERFQEEFLEDPVSALTKRDQQTAQAIESKFQKMLEQVINPLEPVIQEHRFNQEVRHYSNRLMTLAEQNPDIYDLKPAMEVIAGSLGREALRAMEQSGQDPLQVVYEAAKKLHRPTQPAPPTPEQLLSDQNFRQQIIQNPEIKNEILKSHMQTVQQGKPPQLVGSQPGGVPTPAPAIAPRSAKEAGTMLRRQFGF